MTIAHYENKVEETYLTKATTKTWAVHISIYPVKGLVGKKDFDNHFAMLNLWLHSRLNVHKDFEWDRVLFTIYHPAGKSSYPTGLSFANTDDALAFKLAFDFQPIK